MDTRKKKPKSISEYIKIAPKESQTMLREIYAIIQKSIPDATENIKWGMPAFSYDRILVMFAGFKHHIGFYPTPSALRAFAKSLTKYKTAKGSIQFPLDKELPVSLISKIVKFRVKENLEKDDKWRS
jgi:uncharacterized protein YdhG (YjbR/CyaY superfamily)